MKKILVSFLTILLISVVMMGTVYAAQLETTIDITANVSEVSAGDKVVFTFALKNVANAKDDSIGAIEGTVTYDTNFFELVKGATNTSFSAGGESGEKFNVLCGGAKDGETVAILTLKVKDNPTGSGIVKFTDLAASDGDVERGDEAIAKTPDKSIEIKLKSTEPTEPTEPEKPQPDNTNVAVTGVTVAPVSQKVKVGKSTTFIATVTPENATNKKVKWSSSDESIATINEDGVVTGVKEGEATITATTLDGSKTGTATIIVEKEEEQKPTETEKPDNSNNSNNTTTPGTTDSDNKTTDGMTVTVGGKNNDPTIATTVIPKAGISIILLMAVVAASGVAVFMYKKNQKFRDIK